MLDFTHLMNSQSSDVQIFDSPAPIGAVQWSVWTKPRGVSMVYVFCVGAGGGGAGGQTISATAGAGGGGGGSSAQSSGLFPAIVLPDILYVRVGAGGAGGAANSSGTVGSNSNVAIYPFASMVGNSGGQLIYATAGGNGLWAANVGGTGGTAGGASILTQMPLAGLGATYLTAGQAGTSGAANTATAGSNGVYPNNGLLVTGGCGGAGCSVSANAAGGNIPTAAFSFQQLINGGAAGTGGVAGQTGSNGISILKPFQFTGAGGGGSCFNGAGGSGGLGGIGSGGGGGAPGVPAGIGGSGGNGLVIIVSW